jgi:peptidoglycan L-alanyl-D-glutamate endopeptidase CwlK
MNNFYLSDTSLERLDGVDPRYIKVLKRAIKISTVDFGIPQDGGVRTAERQHEMYLDPKIKTNCDGFNDKSKHQIPSGKIYGEAFDYFAYVKGRASWEEHHMTAVAAAILQAACELLVPLEWGGHWANFQDMPHIQASERRIG